VLWKGVLPPVCVAGGCPLACLCCLGVCPCLSEAHQSCNLVCFYPGCSIPSPAHSLSPLGIVQAPLQPLLLILSMVFQLSLPPCKFSLCIFFSFLVLPWSLLLPACPRTFPQGLHHIHYPPWPGILKSTLRMTSSSPLRSFWASSHQY
jgi:hypothetical protein